MPKQRPPFDTQRYESLKAQGLSQRAIAQEMGMPEATLRKNLKVMAQGVAQAVEEGLPRGDQGMPGRADADVSQGPPEVSHRGTPEGDMGIPPLYIHQGIPDDGEESPLRGESISEVHEGTPALPLRGLQEGDQGPPGATLSPELVEALMTAWPDLQRMLAWWLQRQQYAQESPAKLERVTYHVAPKWIEAVRREADVTGESYAAVVNRAFAQYFAERST